MDWLLDNFGKLLPIILMVLYFWMNARKGRGDEEGPEENDDPDTAERARRIQEEIRRRILERQRGDSPQPVVVPPVMEEEELHQHQERSVRGEDHWPSAARQLRDESAESDRRKGEASSILAQQARLQERLEEAQRLTAARRPAMASTTARMGTSGLELRTVSLTRINPLRAALLKDLEGGSGLRRAVLLREVLGEPVGMRRESTFQR